MSENKPHYKVDWDGVLLVDGTATPVMPQPQNPSGGIETWNAVETAKAVRRYAAYRKGRVAELGLSIPEVGDLLDRAAELLASMGNSHG